MVGFKIPVYMGDLHLSYNKRVVHKNNNVQGPRLSIQL